MLEANLEAVDHSNINKVGGNKFQYLRVPYPTSGIDSIVETLKCLKEQGVDIRSIKSSFSPQELFAVLEIENEVNVYFVYFFFSQPVYFVYKKLH